MIVIMAIVYGAISIYFLVSRKAYFFNNEVSKAAKPVLYWIFTVIFALLSLVLFTVVIFHIK